MFSEIIMVNTNKIWKIQIYKSNLSIIHYLSYLTTKLIMRYNLSI